MKKLIAVLAVIALVAVPVIAKDVEISGWGFDLGTCSGVTLTADVKNMDAFATIGFGAIGGTLRVNAGAKTQVTELDFGKGRVAPINVGGELGVGLGFGDTLTIGLFPAAFGEISYDHKINNFEFTTYIRLGAGLGMHFSGDGFGLGFAPVGTLGFIMPL